MADLFSYGPRNAREFFKTNLVPVLYTVIIHLVIAIVLVLLKVEGLKKDRELGVMLDFTEEVTLEELMEQEEAELPPEWIEHVLEAREQASNRAVNVNDDVNREISTEDYVNDLLEELEAQKDEAFMKDREKWKEIISTYVYEEDAPSPAEPEAEDTPYTGPTRITYEFLESPRDRQQRQLNIPVYRCEGAALVTVDIEVLQDGSVGSARVVRVESARDSQCFTDAAEGAALTSTFRGNYNAPSKQKARITYQFVAQ
ncbi:MAG: hypothetical protein P1P82_08085 [Bacteroidales bacterium]|nr:hypothetical protein [Bacteroidales bacterium]MDT8430328.1 hypothetical protein [Bacteroidales bacterium]